MAALLVGAAVFLSGVGIGQVTSPAAVADSPEFRLVREAWDLLQSRYVKADELDRKLLAYSAIRALADATGDTEHTVFLPADEAADDFDWTLPSVPQVSWTDVPDTNYYLLAVTDFAEGSGQQVLEAIDDIRHEGADGIILDLRMNPGGLVDEAVTVASAFISSGVVFSERFADGSIEPAPVDETVRTTSLPTVVLVDGDTFSAAEVVASALQDAGRAPLVGEVTGGTGTILRDYTLTDGSLLVIGYAEWLTRNGESVWHIGVAPDVEQRQPIGIDPLRPYEVRQMTTARFAASHDRQLFAAIDVLEQLQR